MAYGCVKIENKFEKNWDLNKKKTKACIRTVISITGGSLSSKSSKACIRTVISITGGSLTDSEACIRTVIFITGGSLET